MSPESLFGDPHTDARMRRTIPQFAYLGAAAVAVTAPFVAPSPEALVQMFGLTVLAVVVAAAVSWRDLIDRISRAYILGLLIAYCCIIALAVGLVGDPGIPYAFLYLLPVTFTSVFFVGWVRYSLAVATPLLDFVIVSAFVQVGFVDRLVRLVLFVLLAHFGAVVADTLREALRANRSLHTVLEAASGSPLGTDLTSIGVDAALSVAGWDAGAIAVLHGDRLTVPSLRGVSPALAAYYRHRPDELVETSITRSVVETGQILQIPDLSSVAEHHPLVDEGIVSLAALPITFHSDLIAVLLVGHRSTRRLDGREEHRLMRVAEQLGLALGSADAYRREAEAAEHLRELNRHKDEFLANVSHELRTPAAAIQLVASTLHHSWQRLDDSRRSEMFATLERRSRHLTDLIINLLDEALADAGATRLTVVEIDWREAVQRWSELATLETGRVFSLDLPPSAVTGRGDIVKLERVVINLLSNAAKFSDVETAIDVALTTQGGDVVLRVTDHGIGIDPDHHGRIFDRFHQVDGRSTRVVGGFGIGLSLARHFVSAHGGSIDVESEVGRGATFTVRVPRKLAVEEDLSVKAPPVSAS